MLNANSKLAPSTTALQPWLVHASAETAATGAWPQAEQTVLSAYRCTRWKLVPGQPTHQCHCQQAPGAWVRLLGWQARLLPAGNVGQVLDRASGEGRARLSLSSQLAELTQQDVHDSTSCTSCLDRWQPWGGRSSVRSRGSMLCMAAVSGGGQSTAMMDIPACCCSTAELPSSSACPACATDYRHVLQAADQYCRPWSAHAVSALLA